MFQVLKAPVMIGRKMTRDSLQEMRCEVCRHDQPLVASLGVWDEIALKEAVRWTILVTTNDRSSFRHKSVQNGKAINIRRSGLQGNWGRELHPEDKSWNKKQSTICEILLSSAAIVTSSNNINNHNNNSNTKKQRQYFDAWLRNRCRDYRCDDMLVLFSSRILRRRSIGDGDANDDLSTRSRHWY
jgi:hypothetical protein